MAALGVAQSVGAGWVWCAAAPAITHSQRARQSKTVYLIWGGAGVAQARVQAAAERSRRRNRQPRSGRALLMVRLLHAVLLRVV